jgi:hypothetical protein
VNEPLRRCQCCQLDQPQAINKVTGTTSLVCARCANHQGDQGPVRLRRAEAHETMLRTALTKSVAEATEARIEAARAREAVAAALRSRGQLASRVVNAADQAGARAGLTHIANDPMVRKWARREDDDDTSFYRSSSG